MPKLVIKGKDQQELIETVINMGMAYNLLKGESIRAQQQFEAEQALVPVEPEGGHPAKKK